MKKPGILLAGAMALLSLGCPVRSVFPLFAEKDLVFLPELVGTWIEKEDGDSMVIRRVGEANYYLVDYPVGKGGDSAEAKSYYAYLGRLGDAWFLDSIRQRRQDDAYDLIPAHMFYRIWLEGDMLRLAALEGDWLQEMIDGKRIDIAHFRREDEFFLAATTPELQRLLKKYADDPSAFPDPSRFARSK